LIVKKNRRIRYFFSPLFLLFVLDGGAPAQVTTAGGTPAEVMTAGGAH
jgi:hypothetical protein